MAKIKKISLDFDEEPIKLQLISLKKPVKYHNFFFEINKQNKFKFKREKNFIICENSIEYEFLYMKNYDEDGNNICSIIANKSFKISNKDINYNPTDIFGLCNSNKSYLFNEQKSIDFIMKMHDSCLEFSVNLLSVSAVSFVMENLVRPKDLMYQYIQENE